MRPLYDNGLKLPVPMPIKYDEEGGTRTPGQYEELVKQKMQEQECSSLINSPCSLSRGHTLSRGADDGFKSANAAVAPVDWDALLRSQVTSPSDPRLGPSQPLPLTRSGLASTGILSGMASPGNGPFSLTRQPSLNCFDWVDRANATAPAPVAPHDFHRSEEVAADRTRRWSDLQRLPGLDHSQAHVRSERAWPNANDARERHDTPPVAHAHMGSVEQHQQDTSARRVTVAPNTQL
jgi:hypothetical protein